MKIDSMLAYKLPNITENELCTVTRDKAGKILYAFGKCGNLEIFVKQGKNGTTKVVRDIYMPACKKEIASLFDANGDLIHYTIRENGKLIEFARCTLKKVKNYSIGSKNFFYNIKRLITRR